jgi:hypothetical protein
MNVKGAFKIIGEIIRDLKKTDGWDKVIKQINKGIPIERIHCPVCDQCTLEFNYIVNFRDPSNPNRNRVGGGWAACKNCEAATMWDGKIPDWYVEVDDKPRS